MEKINKDKEIKEVKRALEEAVGIKIETPKDFVRLREVIAARTGQYISTTTLKRIWGYLNEPLATRISTYNLLVQTLGYLNWEDFLKRNDKPSEKKIASSPQFGRSINVNADLKAGEELKLYWHPERICHIKYEGDFKFKVLESKNTRLKPGYTFRCHLILAGHPLYLSEVTKGDSRPMAYVCGKLHGGIQFEKIESPS